MAEDNNSSKEEATEPAEAEKKEPTAEESNPEGEQERTGEHDQDSFDASKLSEIIMDAVRGKAKPDQFREQLEHYLWGDQEGSSFVAGRNMSIGSTFFNIHMDKDELRPRDKEASPRASGSVVRYAGDLLTWRSASKASREDLCLIVSIAVLHGQNYQLIRRVADDLIERSKPVDKTEEEDHLSADFPTVPEQLSSLGARRYVRKDTDAGARHKLERVCFVEDEWAREVLISAWLDIDRFPKVLLPWLYDLGKHPIGVVRECAAQAAGQLLEEDWDNVFHGLILRWINRNGLTRWTATQALAATQTRPACGAAVITLLKAYANLKFGRHAAATAALSLRTNIPIASPNDAAEILLALCEHWKQLDFALILGAHDLARRLSLDCGHATIVLQKVRAWKGWTDLTDEVNPVDAVKIGRDIKDAFTRPDLRTTADAVHYVKSRVRVQSAREGDTEVRAVDYVMYFILTFFDDGPAGPEGKQEWVTKVFEWASEDAAFADETASLWLLAYRYRDSRPRSMSILKSWLRNGSATETSARGFANVFRRLHSLSPPSERERIFDRIRRWQNDPDLRSALSRAASYAAEAK